MKVGNFKIYALYYLDIHLVILNIHHTMVTFKVDYIAK